MSSFYFNNYVQPDETEREGMKVLYADKTDPGVVSYINDVVYDVRSGIHSICRCSILTFRSRLWSSVWKKP